MTESKPRVYIRAGNYSYLISGETCAAVMRNDGHWISVAGSQALAIGALANELQESRSKSHQCIWCGASVGIFGEGRICPTCSND